MPIHAYYSLRVAVQSVDGSRRGPLLEEVEDASPGEGERTPKRRVSGWATGWGFRAVGSLRFFKQFRSVDGNEMVDLHERTENRHGLLQLSMK